jgi:hypothetical protein
VLVIARRGSAVAGDALDEAQSVVGVGEGPVLPRGSRSIESTCGDTPRIVDLTAKSVNVRPVCEKDRDASRVSAVQTRAPVDLECFCTIAREVAKTNGETRRELVAACSDPLEALE